MKNLVGRIVSISPIPGIIPTLDYICVGQTETELDLVYPGVIHNVDFSCTPLPSDNQIGFTVVSDRFNDGLIEKTIEDIKKSMPTLLDIRERANAVTNRVKLEKVLRDAKREVFGESANCCAKLAQPNYVGKLVWLEFDKDGTDAADSGEYIVLSQSSDSLYVISTANCLAATELLRVCFGEDVKVVESYWDAEFITDFIDRLLKFSNNVAYSEHDDFDGYAAIDAAETVAHQLQRLLTRNSKKAA